MEILQQEQQNVKSLEDLMAEMQSLTNTIKLKFKT